MRNAKRAASGSDSSDLNEDGASSSSGSCSKENGAVSSVCDATSSDAQSDSGDRAASESDGSENVEASSDHNTVSTEAASTCRNRVAECFDASFPGLEAHAKEHDFPAHILTCDRCQFWKHKEKWSSIASFRDEATGQMVPWLPNAP